MNPENYPLLKPALYVWLGCFAAAIFVQIWMYRKGKASAKDLRELLAWIPVVVVLGGIGAVGSMLPRHSLATSVITSFLSTTASVWLVILTYNIVSKIRLSLGDMSVAGYAVLVVELVLITQCVLSAAHELPRTGGMQSIIVFAGVLIGLAGAWLQDTLQENKSKAVDTDKVTIFRAS